MVFFRIQSRLFQLETIDGMWQIPMVHRPRNDGPEFGKLPRRNLTIINHLVPFHNITTNLKASKQ